MKIKIFTSVDCATDLENKIAEWTKGLNPEITNASVSVNVITEVNNRGEFWGTRTEYMATIIYK